MYLSLYLRVLLRWCRRSSDSAAKFKSGPGGIDANALAEQLRAQIEQTLSKDIARVLAQHKVDPEALGLDELQNNKQKA
jgi:hypothetical protein